MAGSWQREVYGACGVEVPFDGRNQEQKSPQSSFICRTWSSFRHLTLQYAYNSQFSQEQPFSEIAGIGLSHSGWPHSPPL